jgi:hypothetical protein
MVEEQKAQLIGQMGTGGLPINYKQRTLWIRRPDIGFLLSAESQPLPPFVEFLLPDIFLVLPDKLITIVGKRGDQDRSRSSQMLE